MSNRRRQLRPRMTAMSMNLERTRSMTSTPPPPLVAVNRREPNRTFPGYFLTFITCPFCGREHIHGDGPGHRVAHCDAPGSEAGYVLIYPDGWEAS